MMNILILGAGNVGQAIAYDLSKDYDITAGDVDENKLKCIEKYADTVKINAADRDNLVHEMEKYNLIIGALPGRFGYQTLNYAIEAGKDIVDVSFMPENPLKLDKKAKKEGVSAIVDAGFGPGMSNLFMGYINSYFDDIHNVIIRIGGLPVTPQPPLYYKITWSPYDLIEEYTREARVIRNNQVKNLDPFNEINKVKIRDYDFEEFYSDGLRTLLETIDANNMEETTLRWRGHLEKIKVLRELGFFEEEHLEKTLDVISPLMEFKSGDFSIMTVEAEGIRDNKQKEVDFYFYDEAGGNFTSMSRSTGFATASFARLLLENDISKGIIPPEYLGKKQKYYDYIVNRMIDYGIQIDKSVI